MRNRLIFFLTALCFSCGRFTESPIFSEPQPGDGTELMAVPGKLLGTYESLTDSVDTAHLIVTDKEIIMKIVRNPNVSIAELDSTERRYLKDTTYREGNDSLTIRVSADSVFQRNVHFDTLHFSSNRFVLKKSKGYYFCNQRFRDKWIVRTLRVSDHGILISKLKTKTEVTALQDYQEPDSIVNQAPTVDRLRTYLTDERFGDDWMFVTIEYGLQEKL